jgi:hypothetical protein
VEGLHFDMTDFDVKTDLCAVWCDRGDLIEEAQDKPLWRWKWASVSLKAECLDRLSRPNYKIFEEEPVIKSIICW